MREELQKQNFHELVTLDQLNFDSKLKAIKHLYRKLNGNYALIKR